MMNSLILAAALLPATTMSGGTALAAPQSGASVAWQVEVSDALIVYAASEVRPGGLFAVEGFGLFRATIFVNGRPAEVRRSTETQILAVAPDNLSGEIATILVHDRSIEAPVGRERVGGYAEVEVVPSEDESTAIVRVDSDRPGRRVDVLILRGDVLWRRGETPFEVEVPRGAEIVVQAEGAPTETITAVPEETGLWAAPAGGFGTFGGPFEFDAAPVFGIRIGWRFSNRFSVIAEFSSFSTEAESSETILVPQMDELNPFVQQTVKTSERIEGFGLLFGPQFRVLSWNAGEVYTALLAGATWLRGGDVFEDVYFTLAPAAGARVRLGRGVELWLEGRVPLYALDSGSFDGDRFAWAAWAMAGIEIRF